MAAAEADDLGSGTSRFGGKITGISGNIITIRDSKGNEKRLEVRSVGGIRNGMTAICEEDCGRIRVGDEVINVQRVLSSPEAGGKRMTPPDAPR